MTVKFPPKPRFFWIGEESEMFVAESFEQLIEESSCCGTGIEKIVDGIPVNYEGEPVEWGEFTGSERMTIRNCDENERPLERMTGSLHDIYAWTDGGRYAMPVMFMTAYN
ncbi:hypothetical protein [Caballeronia sp. DA-9]|uniref:hypothetical protein n=1 Tax=Caballeronia sp. DA-9 TaxID=3436237 RepID=UPI003F661749